MFPKSITTDCTLYVFWRNPQNTAQMTSIRIPLSGVFWSEDSASIAANTGMQIATTANVIIPAYKEYNGNKPKGIFGRDYISPEQWYQTPFIELHKYFTLDAGMVGFSPPPMQFTRVVRGMVDFEFEMSNVQGLALQMNQFMLEVPQARQPQMINANIIGSPKKIHHIQFRI